MKRYILMLLTAVATVAAALAQTMSLAECRNEALKFNETMASANNAVRQAELDRQIAFTNYLPKLDGSFSAVYAKDIDMGEMTLQLHGTWLAGLNITQPVFAGGKIVAANKLARIGVEINKEKLRQSRMQVIADVDNAYYTLVAVRSKVRMLESLGQQMLALFNQVELSVKAQMATENDLLRIDTKRSEIAYQLQKARNGEQLCMLALANVIGRGIDAEIVPSDTLLITDQPAALDENISNRPELLMLEKQVEAMKQQVKMERANYLPTVGLSLGYTHYDNIKNKGVAQLGDGTLMPYVQDVNGNMLMAMVSVNIPICHWGAEVKKMKKAKLDVENARLSLQQNERAMQIEVRQAVQNVTDGYHMVQTAELGQRQADENLRVMRERFGVKMATMTDLLEAQAQWQQAHSNYIEAQTQYKIYETEYLRVTGRLE